MQRVLGLLLLLLMTREVDDLLPVARDEAARDTQLAGRIAIVDPVTRLAELLVCAFGTWRPLPASLVEDRSALRADGRLR